MSKRKHVGSRDMMNKRIFTSTLVKDILASCQNCSRKSSLFSSFFRLFSSTFSTSSHSDSAPYCAGNFHFVGTLFLLTRKIIVCKGTVVGCKIELGALF